jgi:hypothetical protein
MTEAIINGISMRLYGCILISKEIPPAEPRPQYIEVPGKNGKLDVTDFIGLTFENRVISMEFRQKKNSRYQLYRTEIEKLNGKQVTLTFTDNGELYWKGRLKVTEYSKVVDRLYGISFELDADPFPYHHITDEEVQDV